MSADRISFDQQGGCFIIDNQCGYTSLTELRGVLAVSELPGTKNEYFEFTPRELGKIVAEALMQGLTKIQFDSVTLTVNYIVQMLRFAGKHGWFTDLLSSTADHKFDSNQPTPGYCVGQAKQLLAEAAELEQYALLARGAYRFDEADEAEKNASELRRNAREKLTKV